MSKNPALVVKKSYWQLLKWKDHENRPSVKVWSRGLMRQFARKEISRETRFLFICGLHRSGTSILHEVLREHNSVVGFQKTGVPEDEGQHLQTVMRRDIEDGGPGFFAFSEEACLTESSRVATDANFLKLGGNGVGFSRQTTMFASKSHHQIWFGQGFSRLPSPTLPSCLWSVIPLPHRSPPTGSRRLHRKDLCQQ